MGNPAADPPRLSGGLRVNRSDPGLRVRLSNRAVLTFGLVFCLGGLAFMWIFTQAQTSLRCDRQSGECLLQKSGPFSARSHRIALESVRGAEVVTRRQSSGDGARTNHWAVLNAGGERHDLSSYRSTSRSEHERLVRQVNDFLDNPARQVLSLHHSAAGGAMLFLLLFPAIGLYMVFGVRTVAEVEARPSIDRLILRRRRWWQTSGREVSVPLSQISGVDVESSASRSGKKSRDTHRAVICMRSGEKVPIFNFSTSGDGAFRRAEQLREMLARTGLTALSGPARTS